MDQPIVSPWLVYIFTIYNNALTALSVVVFLLGAFSVAYTIVVIVRYVTDESDFLHDGTPEKLDRFIKSGRKLVYVFIFVCICFVFTPSRNELVAIYAIKELTYNRVEEGMATIGDLKEVFKKDLIEVIDAVNKQTSVKHPTKEDK